MSGPVTLGDQAAAGLGVLVYCLQCPHHGELPIGPLVERYGRALAVVDLAKRCRCTACGSRQVETRPMFPRCPGQMGY